MNQSMKVLLTYKVKLTTVLNIIRVKWFTPKFLLFLTPIRLMHPKSVREVCPKIHFKTVASMMVAIIRVA